jgi:lysophospholipase L1-like esterase
VAPSRRQVLGAAALGLGCEMSGMAHVSSAVDSFAPAWPVIAGPARIWCVGDSITIGRYDDGNGLPDSGDRALDGGFRSRLQGLARQQGKSLTFVGSDTNGPVLVEGEAWQRKHDAHDAESITGMLTTMANILPGGAGPNYVFDILIFTGGTADIFLGTANLAELWRQAVALAFERQPTLVVVTPQALQSTYNGGSLQPATTAFNTAIMAHSRNFRNAGKRLYIIEMDGAISDANIPDGTHPNAAGFDQFAARIWTTLKHMIPNT